MIKLNFWLPNSPDLSQIESVWCLIQQKIEGLKFNDLDELEKKFCIFGIESFQIITKNYLINLLMI